MIKTFIVIKLKLISCGYKNIDWQYSFLAISSVNYSWLINVFVLLFTSYVS